MTRNQVFTRIVKPALFIVCLVPVALWPFIDLGANPIEKLTHESGQWALRFLLITLAVTPLQKITRVSELVRLRRMLGLYAFFYAMLHASVYFFLDQGLSLSAVIADVVERPYITIGFLVFLSLIPLAVTSTNGMIKRLGGRRWKRLHRIVYLSAVGGVIHFMWLVKADYREPLIYAVILAILLAFRIKSFLGPFKATKIRTA